MSNYGFIPAIAVLCYVYLTLTFIAAKKNRIINAFIFVLIASIIWTGGAVFMRVELWPSTKVWYDISILGLTLIPFALYIFCCEFVEKQENGSRVLWGAMILIVNYLNVTKQLFLGVPEKVVFADNTSKFIYTTNWPVFILYGLCLGMCLHSGIILLRYKKDRTNIPRKLGPIVVGMIIMLVGHIGFMLPVFQGYPIDIVTGLINAALLFYAVYQRKLFRLTLLGSKSSCYMISAFITLLIFSNCIDYFERIVHTYLGAFEKYQATLIALMFTLSISIIYLCMKKFLNRVFSKNEIACSENIRKFSLAVSNTLMIDEILEQIVWVIESCLEVNKVYISLLDEKNNRYKIESSTSPLDKRTYSLSIDNPIVQWLKNNNQCLMMKDFMCTVNYKSMWNTEKELFHDLNVECFMPLMEDESLVGFVMMAKNKKGAGYTYEDLGLLESIKSIATIAVKNSRLYKQVYTEARTDELTGLLNRKCFYEVLEQEYEKNKNQALTLIMLSIDDFKLYNQLYGNIEGDFALQNVSNIIKASVGENGYVARYSGKKFGILLPLYDVLAARTMAENINKQIKNMNRRSAEYTMKSLTVSCGICSIPYGASTVRQLVENADMAVFQVKRNGKNGIMIHNMGNVVGTNQEENLLRYKEDIYLNYASTIYALTAAIDTKDHYTFRHSKNVSTYAAELAHGYGMNEESIEIIKEAGLLHDIGKIGIDENILNKPGRLTQEEYDIMKSHVENSISIIRHLPSLDYVIPAVIGHHERYDGLGYPRRIAKDDIPISARILCIADSFDAMISKRIYKKAFSVEYALETLLHESGKQFDPELAALFVKLVKRGDIVPILEEEIELDFEENETEQVG